MEQSEKEKCVELKRFFGFENLHFYRGQYGRFHCVFISDPFNFNSEDILDLQFILSSLSANQSNIFFDDIGEDCSAEEIKAKYLIFKLAQI
jgi:hypothetical protein